MCVECVTKIINLSFLWIKQKQKKSITQGKKLQGDENKMIFFVKKNRKFQISFSFSFVNWYENCPFFCGTKHFIKRHPKDQNNIYKQVFLFI